MQFISTYSSWADYLCVWLWPTMCSEKPLHYVNVEIASMQKAEDSVHFNLFSCELNPYLLPVFLLKECSAALQLMEVCLSNICPLTEKNPSHCFLLVLPSGIRCLFFNQSPIGLRTKGKHSSTLQSDHKAKHNGQLQTDEWAPRHRETVLVSAMGCNLTIVPVSITGRKTIGKRTEPRETFYLQRNLHLSTWWQSSQNKNRNCCNAEWEGARSPCWGRSPGGLALTGLAQPSSCSELAHASNHKNTSVTVFPASEAWKRVVEQILSPITEKVSRNERQKRRKYGH